MGNWVILTASMRCSISCDFDDKPSNPYSAELLHDEDAVMVGRDRWARSECYYGAPSGRALSVTKKFLVLVQIQRLFQLLTGPVEPVLHSF